MWVESFSAIASIELADRIAKAFPVRLREVAVARGIGGKSFVSLNLAAALAEASKRVLIVDADMRRGHLNRFVGTEQAPGLSELIAGKVSLEQAASVITDKLSIIATGERPPNPSELLMSEGFERFLEQASEAYDQVIVVGLHDDALQPVLRPVRVLFCQ